MSVSTLWGLSFKGLNGSFPKLPVTFVSLGLVPLLSSDWQMSHGCGISNMLGVSTTTQALPLQLQARLFSASLKRLIDSHKLPWLHATMEEERMTPLILLFFFFLTSKTVAMGTTLPGVAASLGLVAISVCMLLFSSWSVDGFSADRGVPAREVSEGNKDSV